MKSLNKLAVLILSIFIALGGILPDQTLARTVITTDARTCMIYIDLYKEFHLRSLAEIEREIEFLRRKIRQLEERIRNLEKRLKEIDDILNPGRLGRIKNFFRSDIEEEIERREATRARPRVETELNRAREDLKWQKERLEELEEAKRTERARISRRTRSQRLRDMVASWKRNIEELWNRENYRWGNCGVRFRANLEIREEDDPPQPEYDQIAVYISRHFRSFIDGFDTGFDRDSFSNDPYENDMTGEWGDDSEPNVAAHEAGHEMGLDDQYRDTPDGGSESNEDHENDIMGANLRGGSAVSTSNTGERIDNIAMILRKRGIRCPCGDAPARPVPIPGPIVRIPGGRLPTPKHPDYVYHEDTYRLPQITEEKPKEKEKAKDTAKTDETSKEADETAKEKKPKDTAKESEKDQVATGEKPKDVVQTPEGGQTLPGGETEGPPMTPAPEPPTEPIPPSIPVPEPPSEPIPPYIPVPEPPIEPIPPFISIPEPPEIMEFPEEEIQYRTIEKDRVTCDNGILYRHTPDGMDVEVSSIATGKGADTRDWKVSDIKLDVDGETIRPEESEYFYVGKESAFTKPAAVVFTAIGTQYEAYADRAESGESCHVTGEGAPERGPTARAIDKAGMAAGMGLLVSQAGGEITGQKSTFKLDRTKANKLDGKNDNVKVTLENRENGQLKKLKIPL